MLFIGNQNSLRKQVLTFLIMSIALLSGTSSLVASFTAANQSRQLLEQHSLKIADNLAQGSILSLITGSKENAEEVLQQVLGFSDVMGVAIFTTDHVPLQKQGQISWSERQLRQWFSHDAPTLVLDAEDYWTITAPVYLNETKPDFEEFEMAPSSAELLGYVMISVSKSSLQALTYNLFSYNLMIGLVFAALLVWLQNAGLKRITDPLLNLSWVMNKARLSGEHTYAQEEGPKEVREMAESFNAMMQVLEQQEDKLVKLNAGLESEVAIRTKELTHARDAALVAVRTQSEFLANISHELRTPLQAIMGYIELVTEELEYEGMDAQVSDLEDALSSANRLLSLINSILELAKCESGKMELVLQQTSLQSITQETEAVIRPLAGKNQNEFSVQLPEEDQILFLDKEKTQQILLNLLSNACKFTEKGRVSLTVSIDEQCVSWTVRDTGIGIPEDQQSLIFDKFRQIDGSVKRKYGGTGLGLAISRHFAESMGGTISVSSAPQHGAVFVLQLPLNLQMMNNVHQEGTLLSKDASSTGLEIS